LTEGIELRQAGEHGLGIDAEVDQAADFVDAERLELCRDFDARFRRADQRLAARIILGRAFEQEIEIGLADLGRAVRLASLRCEISTCERK